MVERACRFCAASWFGLVWFRFVSFRSLRLFVHVMTIGLISLCARCLKVLVDSGAMVPAVPWMLLARCQRSGGQAEALLAIKLLPG